MPNTPDDPHRPNFAGSMDWATRQALHTVLSSLWGEERKGYVRNGHKPGDGHMFEHLQRLRDWLNRTDGIDHE